LAEFILEPRKKSWFLSSTKQQAQQFYAIGKMQVSELRVYDDSFRNGDFSTRRSGMTGIGILNIYISATNIMAIQMIVQSSSLSLERRIRV